MHKNTATIAIHVTPEIKAVVKTIAKSEGRTVGNWARHTLLKIIQEKRPAIKD
jgi:hypothetical protein